MLKKSCAVSKAGAAAAYVPDALSRRVRPAPCVARRDYAGEPRLRHAREGRRATVPKRVSMTGAQRLKRVFAAGRNGAAAAPIRLACATGSVSVVLIQLSHHRAGSFDGVMVTSGQADRRRPIIRPNTRKRSRRRLARTHPMAEQRAMASRKPPRRLQDPPRK